MSRLWGCCLVVALSWAHADGGELGEIQAFHRSLQAMSALSAQVDREAAIRSDVLALYDFDRIARVSVGRVWRDLPASQQEEFVAVLKDLIVATYARRFNRHPGPQFVEFEAESVRGGVVVRSEVRPEEGVPVRLDYFFSGGKVFNVAADGVSDLSLRRADYGSVVKGSGMIALLSHLKRKVQEARREE